MTLPDEPCCHTPPLHLVLPSRLTPYEVLWQMAEAVTAAHARFLATARALRRQADHDGHARERGIRAAALESSAAHLEEEILGQLGLWFQRQAQDETPPEPGAPAGVPLLELPDPAAGTHDRLVHALLVMRAKLGALALQTAREADALGDPHDPIARERVATAAGLAVALDELDEALAAAYGMTRQHAEHVARHGRWISRVV